MNSFDTSAAALVVLAAAVLLTRILFEAVGGNARVERLEAEGDAKRRLKIAARWRKATRQR